MASLLTEEEAIQVVDRVLRNVVRDADEAAFLALVDRSLGVPEGTVAGILAYPEEHGIGEEPDAERIVAAARAAV